jgi:hypothetical protein
VQGYSRKGGKNMVYIEKGWQSSSLFGLSYVFLPDRSKSPPYGGNPYQGVFFQKRGIYCNLTARDGVIHGSKGAQKYF